MQNCPDCNGSSLERLPEDEYWSISAKPKPNLRYRCAECQNYNVLFVIEVKDGTSPWLEVWSSERDSIKGETHAEFIARKLAEREQVLEG